MQFDQQRAGWPTWKRTRGSPWAPSCSTARAAPMPTTHRPTCVRPSHGGRAGHARVLARRSRSLSGGVAVEGARAGTRAYRGEIDVLGLIASGLTNREVGDACSPASTPWPTRSYAFLVSPAAPPGPGHRLGPPQSPARPRGRNTGLTYVDPVSDGVRSCSCAGRPVEHHRQMIDGLDDLCDVITANRDVAEASAGLAPKVREAARVGRACGCWPRRRRWGASSSPSPT